jgi:hypothetical protein
MNRYANNTNIQPMQAGSINAAQFTPPPLPSHIDLNLCNRSRLPVIQFTVEKGTKRIMGSSFENLEVWKKSCRLSIRLCGSARVCWPKNQQDRSSGRGKADENETLLVRGTDNRKKGSFFRRGGVLFLLINSLMGDPNLCACLGKLFCPRS